MCDVICVGCDTEIHCQNLQCMLETMSLLEICVGVPPKIKSASPIILFYDFTSRA